MRSCDCRFEMRLPMREKNGAEIAARREGVTVAEVMRRALRMYLKLPEPLHQEGMAAVVELRRRVNEIEASGNHRGSDADIAGVRAMTKELLGR